MHENTMYKTDFSEEKPIEELLLAFLQEEMDAIKEEENNCPLNGQLTIGYTPRKDYSGDFLYKQSLKEIIHSLKECSEERDSGKVRGKGGKRKICESSSLNPFELLDDSDFSESDEF